MIRGEVDGLDGSLTDMQAALVKLMVERGTVAASWQDAGYSAPAGAYAALKSQRVKSALASAQRFMVETEGVALAYKTLKELMAVGQLGSVRLGAAKFIMSVGGMGEAAVSQDGKNLQDMTADELAAVIGKLDDAIAAKSDQAKPVGRQVIEGQAASDDGVAPSS